MCRVLRNPLSAVVALSLLLGVPLNAQADQITLLATVDGITLTGAGTLVNVSIAAGTGDGAVFQSLGNPNENGTFTLGAVAFTAGPLRSNIRPGPTPRVLVTWEAMEIRSRGPSTGISSKIIRPIQGSSEQ